MNQYVGNNGKHGAAGKENTNDNSGHTVMVATAVTKRVESLVH